MIKTNKAKLLTLTFQSQVAPVQVVRTYHATWDDRIETGINPDSNIGYILGLLEKPQ